MSPKYDSELSYMSSLHQESESENHPIVSLKVVSSENYGGSKIGAIIGTLALDSIIFCTE
jgi:hypothetical protein